MVTPVVWFRLENNVVTSPLETVRLEAVVTRLRVPELLTLASGHVRNPKRQRVATWEGSTIQSVCRVAVNDATPTAKLTTTVSYLLAKR